MALPKFEKILQKLNNLLEGERNALLSGDLASLPGFLMEKEQLITELETCEIADLDRIAIVQLKIKRNQNLMSGALSGIQDVGTRLKAVRQARVALETYDKRGFRARFTTQAHGSVEKRA